MMSHGWESSPTRGGLYPSKRIKVYLSTILRKKCTRPAESAAGAWMLLSAELGILDVDSIIDFCSKKLFDFPATLDKNRFQLLMEGLIIPRDSPMELFRDNDIVALHYDEEGESRKRKHPMTSSSRYEESKRQKCLKSLPSPQLKICVPDEKDSVTRHHHRTSGGKKRKLDGHKSSKETSTPALHDSRDKRSILGACDSKREKRTTECKEGKEHELEKVLRIGNLIRCEYLAHDRNKYKRSGELSKLVAVGRYLGTKEGLLILKDRTGQDLKMIELGRLLTVYYVSKRRGCVLVYAATNHAAEAHPSCVETEAVMIPNFPVTEFPKQRLIDEVVLGVLEIPANIWSEQNLEKLNHWLSILRSDVTDNIKRQIDYYFSPENYEKDTYLRTLEKRHVDREIPIDCIAKFNKLRARTKNVKFIERISGDGGKYFKTISREGNVYVRRTWDTEKEAVERILFAESVNESSFDDGGRCGKNDLIDAAGATKEVINLTETAISKPDSSVNRKSVIVGELDSVAVGEAILKDVVENDCNGCLATQKSDDEPIKTDVPIVAVGAKPRGLSLFPTAVILKKKNIDVKPPPASDDDDDDDGSRVIMTSNVKMGAPCSQGFDNPLLIE